MSGYTHHVSNNNNNNKSSGSTSTSKGMQRLEFVTPRQEQ